MLSARCFGLVACAIVDRKVGYTKAVHSPKIPEIVAKAKKLLLNGINNIAAPCKSIPQKSIDFFE